MSLGECRIKRGHPVRPQSVLHYKPCIPVQNIFWDRLFGVVYGQDIARAERAAAETATLYRLPGGADLKPLLFAIHTYYAWLMKLMAVELLALQPEGLTRGFALELASLDDETLQQHLIELESGLPFLSLIHI